jgi:Cu-Zn family superoxide dismutase
MRTTRMGGLAAGVALVAVPGAAIAAAVMVVHGHGPTVVHDPVYAGVTTQVHAWTRDGETTVRLMADGLTPGRTYGAHVHKAPCGSDPLASGGHYQHSTDTSIPLSEREVWLDLTAGADGHAATSVTVPWVIVPGTAGSVVIHANPTNPVTGAAGPRLMCTTVPFGE